VNLLESVLFSLNFHPWMLVLFLYRSAPTLFLFPSAVETPFFPSLRRFCASFCSLRYPPLAFFLFPPFCCGCPLFSERFRSDRFLFGFPLRHCLCHPGAFFSLIFFSYLCRFLDSSFDLPYSCHIRGAPLFLCRIFLLGGWVVRAHFFPISPFEFPVSSFFRLPLPSELSFLFFVSDFWSFLPFWV